jgi:hypothetical protein
MGSIDPTGYGRAGSAFATVSPALPVIFGLRPAIFIFFVHRPLFLGATFELR